MQVYEMTVKLKRALYVGPVNLFLIFDTDITPFMWL